MHAVDVLGEVARCVGVAHALAVLGTTVFSRFLQRTGFLHVEVRIVRIHIMVLHLHFRVAVTPGPVVAALLASDGACLLQHLLLVIGKLQLGRLLLLAILLQQCGETFVLVLLLPDGLVFLLDGLPDGLQTGKSLLQLGSQLCNTIYQCCVLLIGSLELLHEVGYDLVLRHHFGCEGTKKHRNNQAFWRLFSK